MFSIMSVEHSAQVTSIKEEPSRRVKEDPTIDHCRLCDRTILDKVALDGCSHQFCYGCALIHNLKSKSCPTCNLPYKEFTRVDDTSVEQRKETVLGLQRLELPAQKSAPPSSLKCRLCRRRTVDFGVLNGCQHVFCTSCIMPTIRGSGIKPRCPFCHRKYTCIRHTLTAE